MAITLGSQLLGLVAIAFAARHIGPTGIGTYTYCVSVATYLALPTNFGLTSLAMRDVAAGAPAQDVIAEVLTLQVGVAAIMYALLLALISVVAPTTAIRALLPLSGLQVFASAAALDWALQAEARLIVTAACRFGSQVVYLLLVLVLVRAPEDVRAFVLANVVGFGVYAIGTVLLARQSGAPRWRVVSLRSLCWRLRTGAAVGYAQAMALIYYYADTIFIQYLRGPRQLGIYGAASRVPLALLGLTGLWSVVVLPRVSYLAAEGDGIRLRSEIAAGLDGSLALALFIVAAGYVAGPDVSILVFGSRFASAASSFTVLMVGVAVVLVATNVTPALIGLGLGRRFATAATLGAVTNIVVNLALIPSAGPVGAAWATVAAEFVVLVVAVRALSTRIGKVEIAWKQLSILATAVALAVTGAVAVRRSLPEVGVLGMAACFALAGLACAVWFSGRHGAAT